jgi:hypothetical protein
MFPDSVLAEFKAISAVGDALSIAVDASMPAGEGGLSAWSQAANNIRPNTVIIFGFTIFLSLKFDFYEIRITANRSLSE